MTVRMGLALVVTAICLGLIACSGSDEATTSSTSSGSASQTQVATASDYPGAVVGKYRTVNGATYVTESGTGVYYSVVGGAPSTPLGTVLFVIGRVKPVPGVHLIEATQIVTVPGTGSVGCAGTLTKRDGRYFVESSAEGGCGSIELIEGDPQKLDAKVGREIELTVRYCTVTKEGRMVKTDLDPDFACSEPYS
jgi:hypothetical protein